MKRILLYTANLSSGGVPRVCFTIANELISRGFEVQVVTNFAEGEMTDDFRKICDVQQLRPKRQREKIRLLGKFLRSLKPDILIASSFPNTLAAIIAREIYLPRLKLIVSEHTDFRSSPAITRKDRLILRWFGNKFYLMTDGVVAVSEGVKEGLCELTGLQRKHVTVINNPVREFCFDGGGEVPIDLREWWGTGTKILAIGNNTESKDYPTMLRTIANLKHRGIEPRIVIIGTGFSDVELDLVAKLEISDNVRFVGFIKSIEPYFAESEIFLLTSVNEGFANVLVEALAFQKQIVATDCMSGPNEILENGRYGFLAPIKDAEAISNKVLTAIINPIARDELHIHSRKFNVGRVVDKYLKLAK